jgi:hypothetical protein
MNSHSEFITMDEFHQDLMSNDVTPHNGTRPIQSHATTLPAAAKNNNSTEHDHHSYLLITPQQRQQRQQQQEKLEQQEQYEQEPQHHHQQKTPTRPGTAPSNARRFTPSGRPMSITKRIGGGHAYQTEVQTMTSTRYTGIGGNRYFRQGSDGTGSGRKNGRKKRTKSILLAHGARHCDPPALVAMAHQIDQQNGDLQELIKREKDLINTIAAKDHMLSISQDGTQQLDLRIRYLEQELKETIAQTSAREKELLSDLHDTSKKLKQITLEHTNITLVLESKETKLSVMESSATEERETIMRRMVEYDHSNRNLKMELDVRDKDMKKTSTDLANEKAANNALKAQLAALQDSIDSMGSTHALAEADVAGLTQERNALYRNTTGEPPPMQYKRGPPFKLYAWDVLASHPNPKAELEIVYSIFHHFDLTFNQIYIHYATSSATIFASGTQKPYKGASRGLLPTRRGTNSGSGRLRLLMTKSDFRTFCQEAQIWDHPLFSWAFIDLAYDKSILGGTSKGGREVVLEATNLNGGKTNRKQRYFVPSGTMTKRDFKEGLVRLSHARFPNLFNLGEKLECLFEKHIIPHCETAINMIDLEDEEVEEDDIVRLAERYG